MKCHICGSTTAVTQCNDCGQPTCTLCMDFDICDECAEEEIVEDVIDDG